MAESDSNDHQSASSIEDILNSFRLKLSDFSDSCDSSPIPDFKHKLEEISDWVKEQKKDKENPKEVSIEDVGKVIIATINGIEKFKSENDFEIAKGVLDIISSLAVLADGPHGPAIKALCSISSAILINNKPKQPSVVDQLAKAVHDELVHFNKRLQDQKYDGLRCRVSDQKAQLRKMKPGEKLDDPNLWNDYVQFMGELSSRFESPLAFKYKNNLTKEPDVADFVTAVVTYCEAYSCFMALLTAAKGKFADLGTEHKDDEDVVDRKISCRREDAKGKLSFLSEKKYLTFLGRLPYEGGKLTKIVVLSRNMRAKSLVEAVRCSLDLPKMQDSVTVESAANRVSHWSVKVKVEGHQTLPENVVEAIKREAVEILSAPSSAAVAAVTTVAAVAAVAAVAEVVAAAAAASTVLVTTDSAPFVSLLMPLLPSITYWVQFINETNFPMKIVSGRIGRIKYNNILEFVQDVPPHASHPLRVTSEPFTGGYLIIYLNGILSSNTEPPAGNARVIEFALTSGVLWSPKINIQDKTDDEFSHGQDTYNTMTSGAPKVLYWFESGVHFMARAEIVKIGFVVKLWRFVIQDFDPFAVQD